MRVMRALALVLLALIGMFSVHSVVWNGGSWLFGVGDNRSLVADLARIQTHHPPRFTLSTLTWMALGATIANHPVMLLVGCAWCAIVLYSVRRVAKPATWVFVVAMNVWGIVVAWYSYSIGFPQGGSHLHP